VLELCGLPAHVAQDLHLPNRLHDQHAHAAHHVGLGVVDDSLRVLDLSLVHAHEWVLGHASIRLGPLFENAAQASLVFVVAHGKRQHKELV